MNKQELAAKLLEARKKAQSFQNITSLENNFPKQAAFVEDLARFIDAQCSRRAGKTNGLALRFFRTLEKYPKSQCIYLALTRDSARDIMWPVLHELNDRYNKNCTFIESRLTMVMPNGAKLILLGADQKNFIKRLKGRKFPGVGIDEAQDFGSHLQSLVDDVLTPSIADYEDGWLALTGTPGPVPSGYFFEVTQEHKYGYSHHEWTILDNPYMPNPAAFIEDLKTKRQWDDNHPTLLREWRNKWILDVESLWVRYKEKVDHFDKLPDFQKHEWNYIMGIDIGYRDADAIAVVGWSVKSDTVYLIKEVITPKQDITALAEQIKALSKDYEITKYLIDAGGLGKKAAEELVRRHQIPLVAADKTRKQETVELLNDALRLGKFKADKNSRFAKDSYLVQIDWDHTTPDKVVIKKKPHSDIIDAVLYAFKESPAYAYEPLDEKPKYGTKAWAERETKEMFEKELERFQKEADIKRNNEEWSKDYE